VVSDRSFLYVEAKTERREQEVSAVILSPVKRVVVIDVEQRVKGIISDESVFYLLV
jgi:hypothetical protein